MEIKNENQIDVLCIGDTVTETVIKLERAEVHCDINNSACTITLPFGAKIPYESHTELVGVGNPANAAVSIARIGLKASLMTDLGEDEGGKKCKDYWESEKVQTDLVTFHKNIPTNHFYVLWYQPERTILIHHNNYPRKLDVAKLNRSNPKFIYFTSIPIDGHAFQTEFSEWLKTAHYTKLVFQPGTYQIKLGYEAQKILFQKSYLFVVNKEEAQSILNTTENSVQFLLEKVQKLGPEIVCITDGPAGAYMRAKDAGGPEGTRGSNYKNYFMPIYPDIAPPFERTGCGDAFASTFTAALAMGKTPLEALEMAPINSMNVVQHIGAQAGLLSLSEIETYLKNKPGSYKVIEI